MMAGSCSYINSFDKWFTRYTWSKLKEEQGRFDFSGFVTEPTSVETDPETAETAFTDTIAEIKLTENGGTIRFHESGTYNFSGNTHFDGDDAKNLAFYEAGDRVSIRFIYNKYSAEILHIKELTLEQNVHTTRGDVYSNGVFEVADIVLMQKWLLAVPGTILADWQDDDFCEDGKLDIFDLCMMKRNLINQQR